jgi:hypothetical protein
LAGITLVLLGSALGLSFLTPLSLPITGFFKAELLGLSAFLVAVVGLLTPITPTFLGVDRLDTLPALETPLFAVDGLPEAV